MSCAVLCAEPHMPCRAVCCVLLSPFLVTGSTPMTVLTCRMGLRVDNGSSNKLQERLHFLRGMMGGGSPFFTFEGALVLLVCWY